MATKIRELVNIIRFQIDSKSLADANNAIDSLSNRASTAGSKRIASETSKIKEANKEIVESIKQVSSSVNSAGQSLNAYTAYMQKMAHATEQYANIARQRGSVIALGAPQFSQGIVPIGQPYSRTKAFYERGFNLVGDSYGGGGLIRSGGIRGGLAENLQQQFTGYSEALRQAFMRERGGGAGQRFNSNGEIRISSIKEPIRINQDSFDRANSQNAIFSWLSAHITRTVFAGIQDSLETASTTLGSNIAFKAIFREMTPEAEKNVRTLATPLGISPDIMRRSMGTAGAVMRGYGVDPSKIPDATKQYVSLANDLSAFYHVSQNEMFTRFKAAVLDARGEAVDQFGISIKMNAMQNFMKEKGISGSYRMLPEEQKLLLRLEKVQRDMDAMGATGASVSRSGLYQGTVSRYQSATFEFKNAVGKALMPVAQTILEGGVFLFKGASKIVDNTGVVGKFGLILTGLGASLFPILGSVAMFKYVKGFEVVQVAFKAIGTFITALGAGSFALGAAALLAIIAGVSLLAGDIAAWKLGGRSVFGSIFGDYKKHFGVDAEGNDIPTSTWSRFKSKTEIASRPFGDALSMLSHVWFSGMALITGNTEESFFLLKLAFNDFLNLFPAIIEFVKLLGQTIMDVYNTGDYIIKTPTRVGKFIWDKMTGDEINPGGQYNQLKVPIEEHLSIKNRPAYSYPPVIINQTISADTAIDKYTIKSWTAQAVIDSLKLGY